MKYLTGGRELVGAMLADNDFGIVRSDGSITSSLNLNTGKSLNFFVRTADMEAKMKLQVSGEVDEQGMLLLTATDLATLNVIRGEVANGREVTLPTEPLVRIRRS